MSEGRPPSPDFDESRYERPNKNWLCGHTCDGWIENPTPSCSRPNTFVLTEDSSQRLPLRDWFKSDRVVVDLAAQTQEVNLRFVAIAADQYVTFQFACFGG